MSRSFRNTSKEAWRWNCDLVSSFIVGWNYTCCPHEIEVYLVSAWYVLLLWSVCVEPLLPLFLGARHGRKNLAEGFLFAQLHKVQPNHVQHPFEWLWLENVNKRCNEDQRVKPWQSWDRVRRLLWERGRILQRKRCPGSCQSSMPVEGWRGICVSHRDPWQFHIRHNLNRQTTCLCTSTLSLSWSPKY